MKQIKNIGIGFFLLAITGFAILPLLGEFKLNDKVLQNSLNEHEYHNLKDVLLTGQTEKTFNSSTELGNEIVGVYNDVNLNFKNEQEWNKLMHTPAKEVALKVCRAAAIGFVAENKGLLFILIFIVGIFGALLFIWTNYKEDPHAGIKNTGIYQNAATNRGWIGITAFVFLVTFYILLYYFPYVMVNNIMITDVVKQLFDKTSVASQWFLYGLLYTIVMIVMGIRMIIKYRHNNYQIIRTIVVVFFQVVFAFLLVEILPLFDLPARDLKNAWPLDYEFLFEWRVTELMNSGHFGKFIFVWGVLLSIIIIPVMVYFFGKRWYCSWVCGCGGLAETLGDPYRQLSNKKMWAWKLERWLVHGVLVFAVIMTFFTGYLTYNVFHNPQLESKDMFLGISAYNVRELYGFLIGSIFAGVIGTGFYPVFGNRTWCRFGCPLAAYMGIVQRFKSRFRITTNGGQCISCGNCSTYCEQGIDVRAYAQKGQNIVRASCVGCGVCATVCPRGVLKLENGPEKNRFGNEGPIVLGNDGFQLMDSGKI